MELVILDPPLFSTLTFSCHELGWFAFMRVCHLWRSIALNSRSAWAKACTQVPHKELFMLSRSGEHALNVELSGDVPRLRRLPSISSADIPLDVPLESMFGRLLNAGALGRASSIRIHDTPQFNAVALLQQLLESSQATPLLSCLTLELTSQQRRLRGYLSYNDSLR